MSDQALNAARDDLGRVTVGALREVIQFLDDDVLVILARDAEGNGFSPLSEVEREQHYEAETTWMGEVTGDGDGERCVVLWPIN